MENQSSVVVIHRRHHHHHRHHPPAPVHRHIFDHHLIPDLPTDRKLIFDVRPVQLGAAFPPLGVRSYGPIGDRLDYWDDALFEPTPLTPPAGESIFVDKSESPPFPSAMAAAANLKPIPVADTMAAAAMLGPMTVADLPPIFAAVDRIPNIPTFALADDGREEPEYLEPGAHRHEQVRVKVDPRRVAPIELRHLPRADYSDNGSRLRRRNGPIDHYCYLHTFRHHEY